MHSAVAPPVRSLCVPCGQCCALRDAQGPKGVLRGEAPRHKVGVALHGRRRPMHRGTAGARGLRPAGLEGDPLRGRCVCCECPCPPPPWARGVLKELDFFLLRTALRDRPKGPSTANHQPPPTANRHQPPAATNRQPPTTANRHQPPIPNRQPPPTTTNRHRPPPTASRQLPTAHRQHMVCPRAFLGKLCNGTLFFSRYGPPCPGLGMGEACALLYAALAVDVHHQSVCPPAQRHITRRRSTAASPPGSRTTAVGPWDNVYPPGIRESGSSGVFHTGRRARLDAVRRSVARCEAGHHRQSSPDPQHKRRRST